MDYISLEQAKQSSGVRIICTRLVPGPWGEAAKAILRLRNVPFQVVAQSGGEENQDIVDWTKHRNAPIVMYNDESPRVRAMEIIELAERIGSGASLLPDDITERMLVTGLINEIAGEDGFAWNGRLLMLKTGYDKQGEKILGTPMYKDYFSTEKADRALQRIRQILDCLTQQIKSQRHIGSKYLVGNRLSAADVHWAYFSQMLETYPHEQNPMPGFLRKSWSVVGASLGEFDPVLVEQRDAIFTEHLELPIDF
ncbi:MAG: hypothetical protein ACJAVI_000270 [Candidatus Azotimanducaceae bacterium]